jgi:hypothetical protein
MIKRNQDQSSVTRIVKDRIRKKKVKKIKKNALANRPQLPAVSTQKQETQK